MELFYYRQQKNFGDALNVWLWSQLLPGIIDEDNSSIFVGIGTLLNEGWIPDQPFKVVFSTGAGYGPTPVIRENWRIYCIRGPLSAQVLDLEPKLAITDGAALLRIVDLPKQPKTYPISFMPHIDSASYWNWKLLCEDIGLHFIDPTADVEEVLGDIQRSEMVIAEAMHGAIVADALRVPWIPIRAYKHILKFKWQDWCQSLGLDYNPVNFPTLYTEEIILSKLHNKLHNWRQFLGFNFNPIPSPLVRASDYSVRYIARGLNKIITTQVSRSLKKVAKSVAPTLSSDQAISLATSRLEEQLEQFKTDWASGHFATQTLATRVVNRDER